MTRGYTHVLLEKGSTLSGWRYDEVLYLDMIAEDLHKAVPFQAALTLAGSLESVVITVNVRA